jgi:hypothetical protein
MGKAMDVFEVVASCRPDLLARARDPTEPMGGDAPPAAPPAPPRGMARAQSGQGGVVQRWIEWSLCQPELAPTWAAAGERLAGRDLAGAAAAVDALTAAVMGRSPEVGGMDGRYVARCVAARAAELAADGPAAASLYREVAPALERLVAPPNARSPLRGMP